MISGRLNKEIFELLQNDVFVENLLPSLLKIFSKNHIDKEAKKEKALESDNSSYEKSILLHDLAIKKSFNLNALDFKRFLMSIKTSTGCSYPINVIDSYVACLDSSYMFKMIHNYHLSGRIYEIKSIEDLNNLLNDIKNNGGYSTDSDIYISSLELYIRFFNLVNAQLSNNQITIEKNKKQFARLPCGAKVRRIVGDDFSISGDVKSSNLIYNFVVAVGVEKVYNLKIPFLRGFLVDRTRNLTYLSSCKYIEGGFWLNTAGSLGKKIELIQYIADSLNIKINIEISK